MALKTLFAMSPPKEGELPCGYDICFIGYPEERVQELASTREKMQHDRMQTLMEESKKEEKRKKKRESIDIESKKC